MRFELLAYSSSGNAFSGRCLRSCEFHPCLLAILDAASYQSPITPSVVLCAVCLQGLMGSDAAVLAAEPSGHSPARNGPNVHLQPTTPVIPQSGSLMRTDAAANASVQQLAASGPQMPANCTAVQPSTPAASGAGASEVTESCEHNNAAAVFHSSSTAGALLTEDSGHQAAAAQVRVQPRATPRPAVPAHNGLPVLPPKQQWSGQHKSQCRRGQQPCGRSSTKQQATSAMGEPQQQAGCHQGEPVAAAAMLASLAARASAFMRSSEPAAATAAEPAAGHQPSWSLTAARQEEFAAKVAAQAAKQLPASAGRLPVAQDASVQSDPGLRPALTSKRCLACLGVKPAAQFEFPGAPPSFLHSVCSDCKRQLNITAPQLLTPPE